jgi:hypothetical protein
LGVVEARVAAGVHTGAEIDQPSGLAHERGEQVGREHIDGPELGEAVGSLDAAGFG